MSLIKLTNKLLTQPFNQRQHIKPHLSREVYKTRTWMNWNIISCYDKRRQLYWWYDLTSRFKILAHKNCELVFNLFLIKTRFCWDIFSKVYHQSNWFFRNFFKLIILSAFIFHSSPRHHPLHLWCHLRTVWKVFQHFYHSLLKSLKNLWSFVLVPQSPYLSSPLPVLHFFLFVDLIISRFSLLFFDRHSLRLYEIFHSLLFQFSKLALLEISLFSANRDWNSGSTFIVIFFLLMYFSSLSSIALSTIFCSSFGIKEFTKRLLFLSMFTDVDYKFSVREFVIV